MVDYSLWDVIEIGNAPPITQFVEDGYANNESKEILKERWKEVFYECTRRIVPVETPTSAGLVSCDGLGGYDWSDQAKDGPTNFVLMAYSSTSSNSEVSTYSNCSSSCLENTKILNEHNEQLLKDLRTSKINDITYKTSLESVEAGLLVYKKNESIYEEDIKLLKREIHLREVAITVLRRKLELTQKQKYEIQLTVENFENSSKNLSKLLDYQIIDKCKTGLGYNVVPPPYTGNFLPPKPDLSGLEEFENKPIVIKPTVKKPAVETSEAKASADKPKEVISQKMVKPVWNNNQRVNHKIFAKKTHPHVKRNMVPKAVLLKSSIVNTGRQNFSKTAVLVNTARQVSTAHPKSTVNVARQMSYLSKSAHLSVKRPIHKKTTFTHGNVTQKVNTVKSKTANTARPKAIVNAISGNRVNVVKASACKFDGKADEGFFVGYSLNCKAFSVFKNRTRIVEENLHISDAGKKVDEDPRQESECKDQEKENNVNNTNNVNVVSTNGVNVVEVPKKVIHALKEEVWTLVDLPYGKRAIGTKWVFKNKKDERGIVIINKVRLVAQGHTQKEGIDYDKVFSPFARIKAIRLFLAYASFKDFVVYQMDVKSVFLYGKIKEEVYVCQPPEFEDPDFPNKVYKVEKALYGLHKAPRAWHKDDILLVQVYVDDIIFGSTKKKLCNAFEKMIYKKFQMSSMGELTFFLELQVKQKQDGIFISQDKYVAEILKKYSFSKVKNASTPIETQKPLLKDEDGEQVDVYMYRLMIASMMYLTFSRPHIMFVVCACARYQVNPKVSHLHLVKKIFKFISWQCKKQTVVANSTTKAKHVAALSCCGQEDPPDDPPEAPMADNRTMVELLQAPIEGYEDAIVIPKIAANNFELKHGLINFVQNKQFFRHDKEDPAHIRYFNKITSTIRVPNVPSSSIKHMLFPFSIERAARIWLEKEPPRSILTWDDLVTKFINQACPHHGFSELHQLDTFYNALNVNDQDSLNSATGGNFLDKMPRECLKIIESKSKVRQSRAKAVVAKVSTSSSTPANSFEVSELKDMVRALVLDKKNQSSAPAPSSTPALVKAVEPNYVTYGGTHSRDNERRHDQTNEQIKKFYKIFEDMSFEISFTDALILMPKFASTLKALIGNKEKLSKMARTPMNEHCLAVILNKLRRKLGDPGKFLIPCEFPGMDECLALADLDASINLMPLSVWEGLSFLKLTSTCMTLELVDRSVSKPIGIAKDVSVKVGVFHFPADFVVIDFKPDPRVLLILGRCFLKAGRALIDVHKGELTLQYSQEVLGFFDVIASGNPTPYDDLIVSTTSPTLTLFVDSDFLLFEEVDAFLGLEDDPNSPKINPFYYVLEGDILLLEAILNSEPLPPLPNHEQYMPSLKKELKVWKPKLLNLPLMNLLRCMLAIFHDMIEKTMEVFMDDFLVFGNSFENCLSRLDKMLQRCEDTNLCLNWEKSHFMVKEGIVLGHKISKNGIKVDKAKVDVIAKLPHPTTVKGKGNVSRSVCIRKIPVISHHEQKHSAYGSLRPQVSLAKKDAKVRLLWWVLLLQEFDFKALDTKRAENLVADHLSRLENPYENVLDPKEINETFPLETLSMVTFCGDSSASWFADFANYHAGNFIVKGGVCTEKKLLTFSKLATIDPRGDIMVLTSLPKRSLMPVSSGPPFTRMPTSLSKTVTRANDKEKFHNDYPDCEVFCALSFSFTRASHP
uniref:Retrovirus-related Pol polyprotein from transposon TNT 1-94 n=1 Tax=Tanacetum cinerariifolium TaxID=118510 RepID=A0A6L2KH59_TANCI|nr:retrovirus-related Pol polyprotein from transposon TNT 1-94 [Tanacetum cinerariifolium]